MSDFVITFVLMILMLSPFLFLYLGEIKLAIMNGSFIVLFLIAWFNSLSYKGLQEINFTTISWAVLLFINSILFLISFSKLMHKRFSMRFSTMLILGFFNIMISTILFFLMNDYKEFFLNYLEILIFYFLPLYFLSTMFIGLKQYGTRAN